MNTKNNFSKIDLRILISLQRMYFFKNNPIRKIIRENRDFLQKCSWSEFEDFAYTRKSYKYDRSNTEYNWDVQFEKDFVSDALKFALRAYNYIEKNPEIKVLIDSSPEYPHHKLHVLDDDAPIVLYCTGNVDSLGEESIAVIGTRQPDKEYLVPGTKISSLLSSAGYVIVSGLAAGCDTLGHVGALEKNGVTVAVLANGFDTIYPKENQELAKRIIENNGTLVTEYPPFTKIERWYFPRRDRLQAALSDAIFVIATGKKGGTLITVDYAIKLGKRIFAFSAQKYTARSFGNSMLIKQGKAEGIPINECEAGSEAISQAVQNSCESYVRSIIKTKAIKRRTSEGLIRFLKDTYRDKISHGDLFEKNYGHHNNTATPKSIMKYIKDIEHDCSKLELDLLLDEMDKRLVAANDEELENSIIEAINLWVKGKDGGG